MTGHVLALDVGGTRVKTALVGRDGSLSATEILSTDAHAGARAVVARVLDITERRCVEVAEHYGGPPAAVGLTLPGIVDERAGVAVVSANLGWRDVPVGAMLAARLDVPAVLAHDVRAAATAESAVGAGCGAAPMFFVAVGTGIGGAIVLGGDPRAGRPRSFAGAHSRAGEVGHVVVAPDGPPCGCGARGCVETLASAAAIGRRYSEESGRPGTDAEQVAALVEAGDPIAARVWRRAVDALAKGLMACSALLDPELVVVGGGLGEAGGTLLGPLQAAMTAMATFHRPPKLAQATLGEWAGCQGAGLTAWQRLEDEAAARRSGRGN